MEPSQAPGTARPTAKRLEDLKFDAYDLSGKRVDREVALARLKAGGLVLVAGENQAPDPAYLGLFRGDLLVLAFTELTNSPTTAVAPGIAVRPVAVVRVAPLAPPVPVPAPPAVKPAPAIAPVAPKAVPTPALPAKEG